jgi:hypothetical protein
VADGRRWVKLRVVVSAVGVPSGPVLLGLGPRALTLGLSQRSAERNVLLTKVARQNVSAYYRGNAFLAPSGSPFVQIDPRKTHPK